jgi:hypothetical protein
MMFLLHPNLFVFIIYGDWNIKRTPAALFIKLAKCKMTIDFCCRP